MKYPNIRILTLATLLLAAMLAAGAAMARQIEPLKGPRRTAARPSTEYRVHDVGNYWMAISNFGNYGEPNALLPSGEWPAGSGVYYIWEGRFWMGALVGGEPLVSHADYGNYELDPTDGTTFYFGTGPKSIQDGLSFFDDLNGSIGGHNPIGLMVGQRSLAWSLSEYDDFVVVLNEVENVSGGPLNNVTVTWVFDNDVGANYDATDPHIDDLVDYDGWAPPGENKYQYDWVDPMDLDNDGDTGYDYWGWPRAIELAGEPANPYLNGYDDENRPDNFDPEPDGIFDEYQIYLAEYADYIRAQIAVPELGIAVGDPIINHATGDTLRGYLIPRGMSYMYDGDDPATGEMDTGERQLSPDVSGFIGTRILYIPQEPFNEDEWDTFPRPYSHQWWNWESDPGSDSEKYEYMTGTHALSAGQRFMPHPFEYGAGAPVFDYRYMLTTGPFHFDEGETKKFVMVTGVGRGIQGLRENLDNALEAYYRGELEEIGDPQLLPEPQHMDQVGFTGVTNPQIMNDRHFLLPIPPAIPDLHYSAMDASVKLVWDNSAEKAIDSFLGTTDFEGYKIYRAAYSPQNWQMIAAFDDNIGPTYLLNAEGDTLNPIDVNGNIITFTEPEYADIKADENQEWEYVLVDLPDLEHDYVDDGGTFEDVNGTPVFRDISTPVNGLKYYYSVVSYDPAKPSMGLPSIESAKSNYRKDLGGAPQPVIPRPEITSETNLDPIRVVPNPYKGTAEFESRYEDRISFTNVPTRCKISIFTINGDMVDEIFKNDGTTGSVYWDLISRNNQKVVSGLYVYVVESPEGEKKVGKFLIIR